jgi:hypothetical protein
MQSQVEIQRAQDRLVVPIEVDVLSHHVGDTRFDRCVPPSLPVIP